MVYAQNMRYVRSSSTISTYLKKFAKLITGDKGIYRFYPNGFNRAFTLWWARLGT